MEKQIRCRRRRWEDVVVVVVVVVGESFYSGGGGVVVFWWSGALVKGCSNSMRADWDGSRLHTSSTSAGADNTGGDSLDLGSDDYCSQTITMMVDR